MWRAAGVFFPPGPRLGQTPRKRMGHWNAGRNLKGEMWLWLSKIGQPQNGLPW